jgi:ATP-dependent exoDNAse (exonuclease V) alpha subunit
MLAAGLLDATGRIDIAGHVFYPGQPVVTRANNRTLKYGDDEWVRNGDRWTINAGTSDDLYLTNNATTGDRLALPAEYVAAGNVTVNYASTIHRAQGATVDEAHLVIHEHTNNRQLYVAATRGRQANHIHTAPPAFDPDQHGPARNHQDWSPKDAIAEALNRQPDATSAIARRRQLRGNQYLDR